MFFYALIIPFYIDLIKGLCTSVCRLFLWFTFEALPGHHKNQDRKIMVLIDYRISEKTKFIRKIVLSLIW